MLDSIGQRNLRDLLDEQVELRPDSTWLVCEAKDGEVREFTYAEYRDWVDRLASGFSARGVGAGDAVIVHLTNCPEFLAVWFALASLGAVMVPSNVANTAPEMEHLLDHSQAVGLVTQPAYAELLMPLTRSRSALRLVLIARGDQAPEGAFLLTDIESDQPFDRPAIDPEDTLELLFTSGTTAKPKAVMLTHANALRSGRRASQAIGLDGTDRCLTALPVFHVNAQSITVLAALTVGGVCVLLEEYRASRYWDQIREHRATQTSLVAMQLRTLLGQPLRDTDSDHDVRRVFYALNVTTEEKEAFEERFAVRLSNGYGLSEAMTVVTLVPPTGEQRWPSIGLPIDDRVIRILNEQGEECAPYEPGEIVVQGIVGRTLMKGYYRDPEATAETLRDGWLYTGDNAYTDDKGYVYFFDRKKDVIKRAGENISASEVESVLAEHPAIDEAAVIGVPDEIRDEAVKAFIVLRPEQTLNAAEVQSFCTERLASFKVPTIVEFRDALPKTSIGKIEKKMLRPPTAS